jgi:Putative restriction endonuclease
MPDISDFFQQADDAGIRLEIIGGLPVWEALPNLTHQEAIDRIRQTIRPAEHLNDQTCACLHYAGLHIRFPDGSDKHSDISLFCEEPSETESAVTSVPEAVVEIINRGYERKDLQLGPPFYLSQGVKDVIVYDPYTQEVRHFDIDGCHNYQSVVTLTLKCGCQVTV